MYSYECVFIARPDIAGQAVDALTQSYQKIITEAGGKTGKTEYWGLRTLAYKIGKSRKGHYVLMNLMAEPSAILEMERQMRLSEDIMRYMTVRVEEWDEEASPLMQSEWVKSGETAPQEEPKEKATTEDEEQKS